MSSVGIGSESNLIGRIAGQGGMLLAGFSLAQALSFARNAFLGHHLSQGDYGIAAALTLTLQLVETLSDIGPERLILQASDGQDRRLLDAGHAILLLRGVAITAFLFATAPLSAQFFFLPAQTQLFACLAFVPLIKSLGHLDQRRQQKALDNRAYLVTEVGSQLVAFATLLILLRQPGSPWVILWTALAQAFAATLISHVLSRTPWRLCFDTSLLKRFVIFGWPIWLSAFPLVCVYQIDRMIVGRFLGMDALASYSAAFMVTMVPGLIAGKLAQALILPMLSERRSRQSEFSATCRLATEVTAILGSMYLIAFTIAGASALELAFGANYRGLTALIGWLSLMWAVRMVQATPGLALMASGRTHPLLIAGLLRAASLPLAIASLWIGAHSELVAIAGLGGELLSFTYITLALRRFAPALVGATLKRAALLVPAFLFGHGLTLVIPATTGRASVLMIGVLAAMVFGVTSVYALPGLRDIFRNVVRSRSLSRAAV